MGYFWIFVPEFWGSLQSVATEEKYLSAADRTIESNPKCSFSVFIAYEPPPSSRAIETARFALSGILAHPFFPKTTNALLPCWFIASCAASSMRQSSSRNGIFPGRMPTLRPSTGLDS
jgi:hypothetical protein